MRIASLTVYAIRLPHAQGRYAFSLGRSSTGSTTTVVRLASDGGATGYGEACTLGSAYMDGFTEGVQVAIRRLAPTLIGLDPCETGVVNERMDTVMKGNNAAKSAIDVACWDIKGQMLGLPICTMLGGTYQETLPVFEAISLDSPERMASYASRMREDGYRNYQLKLGDDPQIDIARVQAVMTAAGSWDFMTCDANTGWTRAGALRLAQMLRDANVFLEQPCDALEAVADIRARMTLPVMVDELVTGVAAFVEIIRRGAADAINLKITRVGGITKAAQVRDLAQTLGIQILIDEPFGSDIADAVKLHLAASTHPRFLLATSMRGTTTQFARGPLPIVTRGRVGTINGPGLGIVVDESRLGEPIFTVAERA